MSTRSRIAVQREDGSFSSVYVHCNGYPDGVGAVLIAHYTDHAKIARLLALGDLSALQAEIGEQHPFGARDGAYAAWCTAYGRDRGEVGTQALDSGNFDELVALAAECWGEYLYVFAGGAWRCYRVGEGEASALPLPQTGGAA